MFLWELSSVILLLCQFGSVFLASEQCYIGTPEWYQYNLGTKTPYRVVANTDASKPYFKNCKAKKIWMLVRHGTRNPGDESIIAIQNRLPQIRDLILKYNSKPNELLRFSDLYNLENWKFEPVPSDGSILKPEGEFELLDLAERMQDRYPELFPPDYSNRTYYFKYTKKQRTEASAKFFAAGLFGRDKVNNVHFPKPLDRDPILEFYKLCERWQVEVDKNPDTLREKNKFGNSTYMTSIINNITKKLNLGKNMLSLDDIELMYQACTFETAWNEVRKSPWCSVFDKESLKAMEFREDLNYYYIDGYGTEITYKQACPTLRHMFNFLTSDAQHPSTIAYFTHSGALLKMIAHLGLYQDKKPPKHTDYNNNERRWLVSKIGSFATNLAFVLYECQEKLKVAVYHQEKLVRLPACDKDLCDLDEIKKYYKNSIYNCDFKAMCSIS